MEKKLLEWTQPESPAEYKIKAGLKGPLPTSMYSMTTLVTSESKKPGQIAVVYNYCNLSRVF